MSMLLIERSEGLETKLIKTSYSPSAGTAYITFENVRGPSQQKKNLKFMLIFLILFLGHGSS